MIPDKQIKLEWWKTAKDGSGNNTESVYKRISVWAKVNRVGGGRTTRNGQTVLENSIEFYIYFRPNLFITGNWRVVYDGKKFTPQSVMKDNENKFYLAITATESSKK